MSVRQIAFKIILKAAKDFARKAFRGGVIYVVNIGLFPLTVISRARQRQMEFLTMSCLGNAISDERGKPRVMSCAARNVAAEISPRGLTPLVEMTK